VFLCGQFSGAPEFLSFLLKAPFLEKAELDLTYSSKEVFAHLATSISMGNMMQNLTDIEMGYYGPLEKELLANFENVAKNIFAFCPKLQSAHFDFDIDSELRNKFDVETSSSITPFMNMFKEI